jgi:hypothetical protein
MSIIRAKHWDLNDSTHEVIMDICERAQIHDLPSIGMFETTKDMFMDELPITTICMAPENFHLVVLMSKDQSNGSVMIYDLKHEKGQPKAEFRRFLHISYTDGNASLSRISMIVAGFCFYHRNWFVAPTRELADEKVENFARVYWPGFTDEMLDFIHGLNMALAAMGPDGLKAEITHNKLIFSK